MQQPLMTNALLAGGILAVFGLIYGLKWLGERMRIFVVLLALPVYGQEPAPSPAPKAWGVLLDAGASEVSTPEALKTYATARATLTYDPSLHFQAFGRGQIDRTSDGSALSIADFTTFASVEAIVGGRYRIGDSPFSIGAIGAVTWAREDKITTPKDPRLWTGEGIVCVERFAWWPEGGLACAGVGQRGPVGGLAVSVSVVQPIKGGVLMTVDFDLPFTKLPLILRSGAVPTAPTAAELAAAAKKLPIVVKVGLLKQFSF
jgi:hypothetical protein